MRKKLQKALLLCGFKSSYSGNKKTIFIKRVKMGKYNLGRVEAFKLCRYVCKRIGIKCKLIT